MLIVAWNVNMKVIIIDFSTLSCSKHPVHNVDVSNHLVLHLCIIILTLIADSCVCLKRVCFYIEYIMYLYIQVCIFIQIWYSIYIIFARQM